MPNHQNKISPVQSKSVCFLLMLIVIFSCSGNQSFRKPQPVPDDREQIPQPGERKINAYGEYFHKLVTLQIEEALDLSRQSRNLFHRRKEAYNVDAFGEVANSSWFTNRNAQHFMSLEEITRGPDTEPGPDTTGGWIISRAKAEGVTPGFTIKDKHGHNYVIKFDPTGYAEIASGAEVISTKLFYAAGYNTPENYITHFHPKILKVGNKVKFTDEKGRKRYMTEDDLNLILERIQHLPDGRIRALASKYIPGRPIGPFKYKSTRKDDPNDLVPHQHRRELRGLRVVAAWLNHFDTKDGNSLDSYISENGQSYVRHYLIDFGATLGSASHGPNHCWRGHRFDIDPGVIIKNILSLGLYVHPWEKLAAAQYPSIGIYESELFQPEKYKPQVPNPAFENMTANDGFWGAKIVMSFTNEQLAAMVKTGQYSNPEAEQYLLRTLIERRDKIGRCYFNKVCPLDQFEIRDAAETGQILRFRDLAVTSGLEAAGDVEYLYDLSCNGQPVITGKSLKSQTWAALPALKNIPAQYKTTPGTKPEWEYKFHLKRKSSGKWSKWIKVFLYSDQQAANFKLVSIQRED